VYAEEGYFVEFKSGISHPNSSQPPFPCSSNKLEKNTLAQNFQEAKKVKFEMMGCKQIHASLEKKTKIYPNKIVILPKPKKKKHRRKGKLFYKITPEGKENDSMELDKLQCMIKHLNNEIIDIKMNSRKGTSTQHLYISFLNIPIPPKLLESPPANLNIDLEGVTMENKFNYH
jgi:hypothetical protein